MFRFDLWPQTVYSSGGEGNRSITPTESTSARRKVITLPVVLICNLTLLGCRADRGMQARIWLSKSSCELWFVSEGLCCDSALPVCQQGGKRACEKAFRCWFHCSVYILKLSSGADGKWTLVILCTGNTVTHVTKISLLWSFLHYFYLPQTKKNTHCKGTAASPHVPTSMHILWKCKHHVQ